LLETGDPAATMDRMFNSRHVEDLRLIIKTALIAVVLVIVVGLPLTFESQLVSQWPSAAEHGAPEQSAADHTNFWFMVRVVFGALGVFFSFFAPVLAALGAVLAWAYQAGSARLGVVDLFACEISTLCRVAAVVDTVRKCIDRFEHGPPTEPAGGGAPPAQQFSSQESYFPVFDGNARDLQTLEARVVINITAFYTYMKAVRDSMRTLAEIVPQPADHLPPSGRAPAAGPWHEAARNVVYMLFLGLESARHAIDDLVEFEPEKAERTILILLSELEAFRFLCRQFPDEQEVHHQRIMLRAADYRGLVPVLSRSVEVGRGADLTVDAGAKAARHPKVSQWEPAWQLLPELQRRYRAATG
jgi:hypothetical protein